MVPRVIELRRTSGHPVVVNADLIETIEIADDGTTSVVLTTGNLLVVRESPREIREAVVAFRRALLAPPGPG